MGGFRDSTNSKVWMNFMGVRVQGHIILAVRSVPSTVCTRQFVTPQREEPCSGHQGWEEL